MHKKIFHSAIKYRYVNDLKKNRNWQTNKKIIAVSLEREILSKQYINNSLFTLNNAVKRMTLSTWPETSLM